MVSTEVKLNIDEELFQVITSEVSKSAAKDAGLVYVSASDPGFKRLKLGNGFEYLDGRKKLRNWEQINRIKRLVLPPAWENVWICKLTNGHLQATGNDKLGRKQYRYHPEWAIIRSQNKFNRLKKFGEKLPGIRARLEKDVAFPGFPQNKVLAAMVSLLQRINIRIGNSFYEKLYGSFGLTTLKDHHVKISGISLKIMFKGKKGVLHNINLSSRRLARIIQGCKDIPGKELFQYYDEEGTKKSVDSGMVNNYIKEISGSDFTAKDFRTWAGTIQALMAFREVGNFSTLTEMNRKIPAALDIVAKQLGNTRTVCRKYYVHPVIIDLYQNKKLDKYLKELDEVETRKDDDGYVAQERLLMKILNIPVQLTKN